MWCPKCHAGSSNCILTDHCSQCGFIPGGGLDFIDKNPLPNKPAHSIRDMRKRINYAPPPAFEKEVVGEDVAQIIKDAQHRQ